MSKAIHAYAKFPKHGITDNVVKIKDKVQIFDDLSKIIFLIVGRILLVKNSLTYTRFFLILFIIYVLKVYNYEIHFILWSANLNLRPMAEPTLPH